MNNQLKIGNKWKRGAARILIAASIFTAGIFPVLAEVIKPSPNYLIILVHGIGAHHDTFTDNYGEFKQYLESELGLKGYVYSFDVKDPLNIGEV